MKPRPKHARVINTGLDQITILFVLFLILPSVWCYSIHLDAENELLSARKSLPLDTSELGRPLRIIEEMKYSKRQGNGPSAVISVSQPASCPSVNASAKTTETTGPNGSLFFLTCGISDTDQYNGGWSPPTIRFDQLVVNADFSSVQAVSSSVFRPCAPFYDIFRNASADIGVPSVLLAAFAMQESGCNPYATGAGGSAGLLQLSPDKCTNSNCYDPWANIYIGARYLKSLLDADPNIVQAVGNWNGWYKGMTFANVRSALDWNCYAQQNLDYLQQYFNGWLQDIDAYGRLEDGGRLGFFFNLDECDSGGSSGSSRNTPIPWTVYLYGLLLFLL